MNDHERGLYGKYKVERLDGSSGVGGKHEECRYYVLDLEHDPHAKPAILAYAKSCQKYYPKLAADLRRLARPVPKHERSGFFGSAPENPRFGR
jgi:hypothetical protein